MANEVTEINGVTKRRIENTNSYRYDFAKAFIVADGDSDTYTTTILSDAVNPIATAFANITDNLGAANSVEYVDKLAELGFYQAEDSQAVTDVVNVGNGQQIAKPKLNTLVPLRTLLGKGAATVSTNGDLIEIFTPAEASAETSEDHGAIIAEDNATTQSLSADVQVILENFTRNANSNQNVTPEFTNSRIILDNPGVWLIGVTIQGNFPVNNANISGQLLINSLPQGVEFDVQVSSANNNNFLVATVIPFLASSGDILQIGIKASSSGNLTFINGDLWAVRCSQTNPINGSNFITITADKTLDLNDDTILIDANANDVTALLPAASTLQGKKFQVKRDDGSATFFARVQGAFADFLATDFYLRKGEYVTVQSDGTLWQVTDRRTFAFASISKFISDANPITFPVTTTPQKLTGVFTTNVFSTPNRIEPDQANDQINLVQYLGTGPQEGHKANLSAVLTFNQGQNIFIQCYFIPDTPLNTPVPFGSASSVQGLGANDNVPLNIETLGLISETGTFEFWIYGQTSDNAEIKSASLTIERIGG